MMTRKKRTRGVRAVVWMVFTLWSVIGRADQIPTGEPLGIVDRSIEFHGGETYLNSLAELQVCSKSGCYRVTARIQGGQFEIEARGQVRDHERRVRITNQSVEHWQDGQAVEVEAGRAGALRDWVMARAYFVFLPFRLNDDSVIQENLGIEIWNDRSWRKVKVSFVAGSSSGANDEFLYWFDPETARLEQFAYSFAENSGGLRLRRLFNYRRVGGVLFFDQENWGVDGGGLSVDQVRPDQVSDFLHLSTVTVREITVQPLE